MGGVIVCTRDKHFRSTVSVTSVGPSVAQLPEVLCTSMCIVYGILFTCWAFQSFTRKNDFLLSSFVISFFLLLVPPHERKGVCSFFSKDAFGIGLRTEKRFFSRIA